MPFSRRPTYCLPIESQTLTIWPWNHLDLRQVKLNLTDVHVAKLPFFMRWSWYSNWPRYGQDVTPYQNWRFYVNSFKSLARTDRQTDTLTQTHIHDENITRTAYARGKNTWKYWTLSTCLSSTIVAVQSQQSSRSGVHKKWH